MSAYLKTTSLLFISATTALALSGCGGIPVNVNGKTMIIGGGGDSAPGSLLSPLKTDGTAAKLTVQQDGLQPMYKAGGKVQGSVINARESGFKDCSSYGVILDRPAATIVVKEEQLMTMRLREEGMAHGFLLMLPGDKYVCHDLTGDALTRKFEPGTYYVYPTWSVVKPRGLNAREGEQGTMNVEIELRTLANNAKTPEFIVDGSMPNPFKPESFVYAGSYNEPKSLGYKDCGYNTWITSTPIMKVTFTQEQTIVLGMEGQSGLVMVDDQKRYNCGISTRNPTKFEPGTYSFHAFVKKEVAQSGDASTFKANFYSEAEPPTIKGEVPVQEIDTIETPLVLKVKSQEVRYTAAQGCEDVTYSAQPDLYIDFKRPVADFKVMLVEGKSKREVLTYQDITKQPLTYKKSRPCGDSYNGNTGTALSLRQADGRYALFLGHAGSGGKEYNLIMTSKGTQIDPYLSTAPIPEGLGFEQRAVHQHYPLMSDRFGGDLNARVQMWERTPKQLWLYVSKPVTVKPSSGSGRKTLGESKELTLEAGEPVQLRYVTNRRKDNSPFKVSVVTADLWTVEIEAEHLTTQAPASVNIPTKPRAFEPVDAYVAEKHADAKAQKAIDGYKNYETKYNKCFDAYWDKHGGSSAKNFVRITRNGSGNVTKVKNLGDEIAERADKKCGGSKLDPLEATMNREIWRSFEAMRAQKLKTLAK